MSDSEIVVGGQAAPQPNTLNPTADVDFPIGTPLYAPSSGRVGKAKADAAGTAYCVGLALAAGTTDEHCATRYCGPVTLTDAEWTAVLNTGTELTPGAPYYVSQATGGKLTKTMPGSGIITTVGIAVSSQCLLVNPSSHTGGA